MAPVMSWRPLLVAMIAFATVMFMFSSTPDSVPHQQRRPVRHSPSEAPSSPSSSDVVSSAAPQEASSGEQANDAPPDTGDGGGSGGRGNDAETTSTGIVQDSPPLAAGGGGASNVFGKIGPVQLSAVTWVNKTILCPFNFNHGAYSAFLGIMRCVLVASFCRCTDVAVPSVFGHAPLDRTLDLPLMVEAARREANVALTVRDLNTVPGTVSHSALGWAKSSMLATRSNAQEMPAGNLALSRDVAWAVHCPAIRRGSPVDPSVFWLQNTLTQAVIPDSPDEVLVSALRPAPWLREVATSKVKLAASLEAAVPTVGVHWRSEKDVRKGRLGQAYEIPVVREFEQRALWPLLGHAQHNARTFLIATGDKGARHEFGQFVGLTKEWFVDETFLASKPWHELSGGGLPNGTGAAVDFENLVRQDVVIGFYRSTYTHAVALARCAQRMPNKCPECQATAKTPFTSPTYAAGRVNTSFFGYFVFDCTTRRFVNARKTMPTWDELQAAERNAAAGGGVAVFDEESSSDDDGAIDSTVPVVFVGGDALGEKEPASAVSRAAAGTPIANAVVIPLRAPTKDGAVSWWRRVEHRITRSREPVGWWAPPLQRRESKFTTGAMLWGPMSLSAVALRRCSALGLSLDSVALYRVHEQKVSPVTCGDAAQLPKQDVPGWDPSQANQPAEPLDLESPAPEPSAAENSHDEETEMPPPPLPASSDAPPRAAPAVESTSSSNCAPLQLPDLPPLPQLAHSTYGSACISQLEPLSLELPFNPTSVPNRCAVGHRRWKKHAVHLAMLDQDEIAKFQARAVALWPLLANDGESRSPCAPATGQPTRRVLLDLGANDYSTSITWFKQHYPGGESFDEYIAYEVNERFFKSFDGKPRVTLRGVAVSPGSAGYVSFHRHKAITVFHKTAEEAESFVAQRGKKKFPRTIPAVDLVEELEGVHAGRQRSDTFVVVKMDIEGIELSLLDHMAAHDAFRLADEWFVECHNAEWNPGWVDNRQLADCHAVFNRLRQAGVYVHEWY